MQENCTSILQQKRFDNINFIKTIFKTKKLVTLAVIIVLNLLLSFFAIFATSNLTNSVMSVISSKGHTDITNTVKPLVNISMSSMTISMIFAGVIALIYVFAYLFIYIKCNSKNPNASPKAGFIILFVFSIIELVFCSLYSLFAFLAGSGMSIAFITGKSLDTLYGSSFNSMYLTTFIVILAVMIFVMLFVSINKVRYINSIRKGLNGEDLSRNGAKPTGVFYVIYAVFCGICTLLYAISSALVFFASNSKLAEIPFDRTALYYLIVIGLTAMILTFALFLVRASIAFSYSNAIDNALYDKNNLGYADGFSNYGSTDYYANNTQSAETTSDGVTDTNTNDFSNDVCEEDNTQDTTSTNIDTEENNNTNN